MGAARICVVGGGLAGLAAAIASARAGARVTLLEKDRLGRNKVCGEFLSPETASDFEALGCADWARETGARPMRSILLASRRRAIRLGTGAEPGFSVTRKRLESYLAERARAAGVDLIERTGVRAIRREGGRLVCEAPGPKGEVEADHVLCAFGKRSSLDAALGLPRARQREPFVAAKAYFAPAPGGLDADVELHLIPGGYVGLNAVEDGRVALCALLEGGATSSWERLLERFSRSPRLAARLERLGEPLGPVRGLACFGFGHQATSADEGGGALLFCGDAARMMPPFTGDGMAVALRSGRLAARALSERRPAEAYARAYRNEFRARLALAGLLHRALLREALFDALAGAVGRVPGLPSALFSLTRGRPEPAPR